MTTGSFEQLDLHPRVELVLREDPYPRLGDLALFLQDVNLLFEVSRIRTDPKYADFRFDRYTLYRNRERLDARDRLVIEYLSLASPLEVLLVSLAGGTVVAGAMSVFANRLASTLRAPIKVADDLETLRGKKIANDAAERDAETNSEILLAKLRRERAMAERQEIANVAARKRLAEPEVRMVAEGPPLYERFPGPSQSAEVVEQRVIRRLERSEVQLETVTVYRPRSSA